MSGDRVLSRVLLHRSAGVVVLGCLTIARLLTDGGLTPDQATEVYLLAITAVVLSWCYRPLVRAVSRQRPQPAPQPRHDLGERPERLGVLEEMVAWGVRSPYVRDRRLRPVFRELLAIRLRRAGIDLDADPRVPAILGPTGAWLASPGLAASLDEGKAGLSQAQLLELSELLATLDQRLDARPEQTGEQH